MLFKMLNSLKVIVMLLTLLGLYKVLLYVDLIKIFIGDLLSDLMNLNMLHMNLILELILDGELYFT